jgi:6-phospho-3-hexuloisomerase
MNDGRVRLEAILDEMRAIFGGMDGTAVMQLADGILRARQTFLYGVGRNGLILQAFAMRLMHLSLQANFVGQLTVPPADRGDLFLAASALGRLPTADALILRAGELGARMAVITARPDRVVRCDLVIHLPAQTMADTMTGPLPLGSPFELALHLLCELTVIELMARTGRTNGDLAARHANLL